MNCREQHPDFFEIHFRGECLHTFDFFLSPKATYASTVGGVTLDSETKTTAEAAAELTFGCFVRAMFVC